MLWESVTDSCDVCHCTRLFNNAFNIRSTPEESMKSKPKARRLLGMASRRLINSDNVSPSMNKENSIPIRNLNLDSSPYKNPYGTKKARYPLDDCDQNSQDSGYGTNNCQDREDQKSCNGFQFAEPLGVAPRRLSLECRSPMRSPVHSSPQTKRRGTQPSLFRSLSSGYESMDDGFNDLIDMENLDEMTRLPNGISSLISGEIVAASSDKIMECDQATTPEFPRTKMNNLRRSLSLTNERFDKSHNSNGTPPFSKVRSCLFRSPNASSSTAKLTYDDARQSNTPERFASPSIVRSFKRPEPPTEDTLPLVKRSRKSSSFQGIPEAIINHRPKCLQRSLSQSDAHADIESAIHRSTTDSDLTGDFSKPCILPLASGDHKDLKSISAETLVALINGEFQDRVSTFKIVDCRYPYEFEAGHIKGAVNLYSKDLIEQFLLTPLTHTPEIQPDENKRSILVFHCEFSWERGPNLSRFLRSIDRQRNKEHYPALHYPEVYLLHGGYEQFYKTFKDHCAPQGYRPMKHPDHEADLRMFRSKSKSWQGEKTRLTGLISRTNLKRLGF